MISMKHLSKHYGDLVVLKDITAEILKGEVVSIIGPSGTGKSTLLRCLNLLERPDGGSLIIDGINILDKKANVAKIRQRMNMVFQSFNLFNHLSVLQNLTIGPVHLKSMSRALAKAKAMELLRLVGLAEKANSYPDELSGGQKQRVAIARCLAMEPEIILFDEPTSALDPTMVREVLSVIRRLARDGMTMAIVTHEMEFARDVSNRVLYMDEGMIYEQGPPDQVFDHPQKERTRAFINRIRSYARRIASRDYDLYDLNAGIETFCEKEILPRQMRDNLLLLVEELLQIYAPQLGTITLDIMISHLEKQDSLEVILESTGDPGNPLESTSLEDDLGLTLIRNLTDTIIYRRVDGKNRLECPLKRLTPVLQGQPSWTSTSEPRTATV